MQATGTFEVTLTPQASDAPGEGVPLARLSIAKRFAGGLVGTSAGEMLSAVSSVKGSAAYVALERVTGVLDGRRGTFALQHTGVMDRGTPSLVVRVVPDSGTGELAGLRGEFAILIEGGTHRYVFDYTLETAA